MGNVGWFFASFVISLCQVTKLLAEILMKKRLKLNGKICRKLENFSKVQGIETNFGQNSCPIMQKFTLKKKFE